MPTKKYRLTKLQSDGSTLLTMHQETDADIVLVDNTSGHYQGTATNVQDALEEVYTAVENLPQPMIFKGTLGTGGTITTLPSASSSNEGYTYKVITAGTYQSVVCKVGDVVISNGSAWTLIPAGDDVEDTWRAIYVGSTELAGNGIDTGKVSFDIVSGTHLTVFGSSNPGEATVHYGVANGYSIPSDADFSTWNAKYDLPSGGIPATDLATGVQSSLSKADTALQSNQTITLSGDASGSGTTSIPVTIDKDTSVTSGSTKVVTSGAVYSAVQNVASSIPTKTSDLSNDSGFLTSHQSIKSLDTTPTTAQSTNSSEAVAGSGTIKLHKVAKTGTYSDLIGTPTNVSSFTNDSGYLTSSDVDQTYSSSSTNAQSGVAVASAVQDVMEVAQGKAANYVCSDVTNAVLNSQNNVVTITSSLTDIKGDSITIDNLKIGDSIYVTETNVPDRWVGAFGGSPLPNEYKELTYIQNTGTGYVDLGFVPIANSTVYIKCNKNSSQSQANHSIFGVGNGGSVYSLNFVSQRGYDIGYAGWTSINTAEYHNDGLDHIWKAHMYSGEQKIYRDDVLIVSGTRTGNVDTAGNMYAFRSDLSYNTKMKLYYLYVIDDNDVKVHDFRPCYRVADNVIGLYDVSTSTFCPATNQSSFSIGNTITRTSVDLYKLETAKVPVSDVQVNGTSVVTNNIANVSVPTNYVTTDTSQTISAQKKFTTAPILDWKVFLRSKYSSAEDYTNVIGIGASGNVEFGNQWHDSMITAKDRIYPNADNKVDFGSASYRYKNLYLTGQIKDGNNADYGLVLPNSTSYTANKTIATTDDIPEQEMYWCTYNTTTYAQISQALSDGKVPMIKYNGITYMYSKDWGSSLGHLFGTMDGNFARWVYCKQTSVWGTGYMEVENSVNKTQALSSSSTVTQYPSAKCVYTALQTKSTVSGTDDGTNWTTLTVDGVTKGFASSGGALEITEVDSSSGSTASIDAGKCYNFGTRGDSSAETITLTFDTNYTGEFILKVFAKNNDVTLATNISSSILDVSTPLSPAIQVSGSNIVLTAGYMYLLSIMSGVIYGTYVDRDLISTITNVVLMNDNTLTFTGSTYADTFKFGTTSVSPNGTDISSLLSSGINDYTFTSSDSTGKYLPFAETIKIVTPSDIPAPTNLTLSGTTLTWTAPTGLPTGASVNGYYVYDNNGHSTSVTTTSVSTTGFSGTIYVCEKCHITTNNTLLTIGYSCGTPASTTL